MNSAKVNPEMLIIARESRGFTQKELAKQAQINQSALSKYESGMLELSSRAVERIALTLRYPESLFYRTSFVLSHGGACLFHRKRQKVSSIDIRRIHAIINLKRMHVQRLITSVEFKPVYNFPHYEISAYENNTTLIAELVRQTWRIPEGPIKNLVQVIEKAGGIIMPFNFGTRHIDAISVWEAPNPPIFFINSMMSWDRIRFSLAHEIGHMVMHISASLTQEDEANDFASSFLMPAEDIRTQLAGITLQRAAQLKPYWKASMASLIYRAKELGEISKDQYRRLFTQLSKMGFRRKEPISLTCENLSLFNELINIHIHHHEYSNLEMSKLLDLNQSEFETEYLINENSHIKVVK